MTPDPIPDDDNLPNDTVNLHVPECPECGAPSGLVHDPVCLVFDPWGLN